jgi:signal transduction histidine kinase
VSSGAVRADRAGDAAREEMLNWLAHEMKTPLGAARMSAQLLVRQLEESQASGPLTKLSETIIRQLDRMNVLMTSILDASRLSEGKVRLNLASVDLLELVEDVIRDWRELQPERLDHAGGRGGARPGDRAWASSSLPR